MREHRMNPKSVDDDLPYVGEIRAFAFGSAPTGWIPCTGAYLPISQNQALFAVIGTTYGGDGHNTFAIPDLRGRTPIKFGPDFLQGSHGGQEAVILSIGTIPAHTHAVYASTNEADSTSFENSVLAVASGKIFSSEASIKEFIAGTLKTLEAGKPHENMQLTFVLGPRCRLSSNQLKPGRGQRVGSGWFIMMATLVLATIACSLTGRGADTVAEYKITRLPALTRTPLPTLTPTPAVNPADGGEQTQPIVQVEFTPAPTPPVNPAFVPAGDEASGETAAVAVNSPDSPVDSPGWSLSGAQLYPDLYPDGLLVYGQVTNNTGSPQALAMVTGTLLDAQGQLLATGDNVIDFYWPIDIVPAGGTAPFKLVVEGIQNAANFQLIVEAEPSNDVPRQDFEFFNLNQSAEDGLYCLRGGVRNPGGDLKDYLTVVAVLYDEQDRVINFSDYYEPYPEEIKGDQTLEFDLCLELEGKNAARHELLAWGE